MVQNRRGALQFGQVISDVASGIAMSPEGPTTSLTSYKAARKKSDHKKLNSMMIGTASPNLTIHASKENQI